MSQTSICQTAFCNGCTQNIASKIQEETPEVIRGDGRGTGRTRRIGCNGRSWGTGGRKIERRITGVREEENDDNAGLCAFCIDVKNNPTQQYDPDRVLRQHKTRNPMNLSGKSDIDSLSTTLTPKFYRQCRESEGAIPLHCLDCRILLHPKLKTLAMEGDVPDFVRE